MYRNFQPIAKGNFTDSYH